MSGLEQTIKESAATEKAAAKSDHKATIKAEHKEPNRKKAQAAALASQV